MSNYSFTQVRYTTLARGSVLQYLCSEFFFGRWRFGSIKGGDYPKTPKFEVTKTQISIKSIY